MHFGSHRSSASSLDVRYTLKLSGCPRTRNLVFAVSLSAAYSFEIALRALA